MTRAKAFLVTASSLAALAAVGYGIHSAIHSSLFLVQVVEVADQPENAPVDAHVITQLADVPVGKANLFDLDMSRIEKRIKSQPWIRDVHLVKRLPQTLSISVTFREPQALMMMGQHKMAYVDQTGTVFGEVTLARSADLPVLAGMASEPPARIQAALKLIQTWNSSPLSGNAQIATLTYDNERGFRALVTYPLLRGMGRTMVSLGHDFDAQLDAQLGRLRSVLRYLADNSIPARQIWADTGKKVVVKLDRRS